MESGGDAEVDGIDVSSRKKKCGGKRKELKLSERICEVPLHKWGTIWSLASHVGVSRSTAHQLFKHDKGRVHSNVVEPFLTAANMQDHINFCRSHINFQTNMCC